MIIDCHYHHKENMLLTKDLMVKMDEAGVDRIALIADLCDPIPPTPQALISLLQFFLKHRSVRGIGEALAANFTKDGSLNILGKIYKIYPDPDNEPVFAMTAKYPERFYGWVFVNPRGSKDPVAEINRWSRAPGFIGIKAHPFWHRYPTAELVPAAEMAVRLKKPLLVHLGFGDHGDIPALADAFPELKLLLAHAAFPCYADSWKIIRDRKNICVDLSAAVYVGETIARDVVEYLGVDRCLYGTDGPFGHNGADGLFDYGFLRRRIDTLFPDEITRKKLLGENFARLAGL
jgi:uncharacterized protein